MLSPAYLREDHLAIPAKVSHIHLDHRPEIRAIHLYLHPSRSVGVHPVHLHLVAWEVHSERQVQNRLAHPVGEVRVDQTPNRRQNRHQLVGCRPRVGQPCMARSARNDLGHLVVHLEDYLVDRLVVQVEVREADKAKERRRRECLGGMAFLSLRCRLDLSLRLACLKRKRKDYDHLFRACDLDL